MNELIVKCKEDTWKIQMTSQGTYKLYHNNYVMVSDEERYITSGFHDQKHYPEKLSGIFHYIENYDWRVHLEDKKVEETEEEKVVDEMEENITVTSGSILNWIRSVIRRIFRRK